MKILWSSFLLLFSLALPSSEARPSSSMETKPATPGIQSRFLRGGISSSGGYSGGGYSGGGFSGSSYSGYHSGTHYTHSYSGRGATASDIFIAALILVCCPCCLVFYLCCSCCCGTSKDHEQERFLSNGFNGNSYGSNQPVATSRGNFHAFVLNTKKQVENTSIEALPPPVEPYSGKYSTSYIDRITQVQWNATLNLHFTRDFAGRGYRLSGNGHDVDGTTVIEDGHANFDGTAWWKEQVVTGDVGLQVVSWGRFDFVNRTFQGNWLANSGEEAPYISFQAEEQPNNNWQNTNWQQRQHPTPSAPMDDDVPVATAFATSATDQDEIPVVVASAFDPKY